MKRYTGINLEPAQKTAGENHVEVTDLRTNASRVLPLEPSLKLRNHSPTGFSWGYTGSGSAQLALAILLDFFGEEQKDWVLANYQQFKEEVVARWDPAANWVLVPSRLREWARDHGWERSTPNEEEFGRSGLTP